MILCWHAGIEPRLQAQQASAFSITPMPRGSGSCASGRAMAFCPSELGLNPGTGLAFFRNDINLFLVGVRLSLKRTGHRKCYTLFLLLSWILSFKQCEYINCIGRMNQRKENKITKRGRERPIFKKILSTGRKKLNETKDNEPRKSTVETDLISDRRISSTADFCALVGDSLGHSDRGNAPERIRGPHYRLQIVPSHIMPRLTQRY